MRDVTRIMSLAIATALVAGVLAIGGAAPAGAVAATSISVGNDFTCAITAPAGGLRCWGYNEDGELGDGTVEMRDVPTKVKKMSKGVTMVATGSAHACAIKGKKGTLYCWGDNDGSQLGTGSTDDRHVPTKVKKMAKGVTMVAAGSLHTCAIKGKKGTLYCWGNNGDGQVGYGMVGGVFPAPTKVKKMAKGVMMVATGVDHTCAIKGKKGTLYCWGYNGSGQLGNGTVGSSFPTPAKVKKMTKGVGLLAGGNDHTCAIKGKKGTLYCWGDNDDGAIGIGTAGNDIPTARKVKQIGPGVRAVTLGSDYTCAVDAKGAAKCWGEYDDGNLGTEPVGESHTLPAQVVKMKKKVWAIAAASDHTCAIKGKGVAFCWGDNFDGQLGDGTTEERSFPVKVKL